MMRNQRTPPSRIRKLRPLNEPRVVDVEATKQGNPARVLLSKRFVRVARIQDCWRIDDEWWRIPISRRYVQAVLETGTLITLYHDLVAERWYLQGA